MSAKTTRTYLSIGEVLSLLRADFPDVTISKIRFLEGQGLVSPERTTSGYRKFHEPDVDRLRFVLQHQREHFLPLKVIRERMEEAGLAPATPASKPGTKRKSVSELVAALQETPPTSAPVPTVTSAPATPVAHGPRVVAQRGQSDATSSPAGPSHPGPSEVRSGQGVAASGDAHRPREDATGPQGDGGEPSGRGPRAGADRQPRGQAPAAPAPVAGASEVAAEPSPERPATVCTAEELAAAVGIEAASVASLVDHGIVSVTKVGKVEGFDEDAVAVAKAAAGFLAVGLEPRHLKVLQHGVLREMGMIETLVLPLLQQRTPEARVRAREEATQFARLSTSLRAAMLRQELRRTVG